jgi:hypothetical protein
MFVVKDPLTVHYKMVKEFNLNEFKKTVAHSKRLWATLSVQI